MPKRMFDEASIDETFHEGSHSDKLIHLTLGPDDERNSTIHCFLPAHSPLSFPSYSSYEQHYTKWHLHRCTDCDKNFPTNHFLNLHIAENHDPVRDVLSSRGDTSVSKWQRESDIHDGFVLLIITSIVSMLR